MSRVVRGHVAVLVALILSSAVVVICGAPVTFAANRGALNDAERDALDLCNSQARGAIWFSDTDLRNRAGFNEGYYAMGVTVDNDQEFVEVFLHGSATTCVDNSNVGDRFYAIRIRSESGRLDIPGSPALYRGQWDNSYAAYDWTSIGNAVQGTLDVRGLATGPGGGTATINISLYRCPSRNGTTVSGDPGTVCYASDVPVRITRRAADWSITPTSNVNPPQVIAGGSTTFTHDLRNTGGATSSLLTGDIYERWDGSSPRVATRVGGATGVTINGGATRTFTLPVTVPASAQPGDRVCQWIVVTPQSQSNATPRRSAEVCATVVESHKLTPAIALDPDDAIIEDGNQLTLRGQTIRAGGSSDTSTFDYTWRTWFDTGGSGANTYQPGEERACGEVNRTGATHTGSGTQEHETCPNVTAAIARNGGTTTAVCAELTITATDPFTVLTQSSAIRCVPIGKYPHLEARNGDVWAGGQFKSVSATCAIGTKPVVASSQRQIPSGGAYYTSYATYGVTSLGSLTAFGSKGISYDANPAGTIADDLVFANTSLVDGYFFNAVGDNNTPTATHCLNDPFAVFGPRAIAGLEVPGSTVDISDPALLGRDLHLTATSTVNLSATQPLPAGTKMVIYAASANIRISSNIRYADQAYGSINQIPQIVVLSDMNIVVRHDVEQLDGIYGAKRNLYTCELIPRLHLCDKPLRFNGAVVIGGNTVPLRTAGADAANPVTMAEVFNLRSDMFLNQLPEAGGSSVYIKTLSETEAPPRF